MEKIWTTVFIHNDAVHYYFGTQLSEAVSDFGPSAREAAKRAIHGYLFDYACNIAGADEDEYEVYRKVVENFKGYVIVCLGRFEDHETAQTGSKEISRITADTIREMLLVEGLAPRKIFDDDGFVI